MSIYISTGAFQTADLPEILAICQDEGISGIELSSGLGYIENLDEVMHEAHLCAPLLLHNYFPAPREPFVLNLAAEDPVTAEQSMALCNRAIQLSASVGAPFYSVHSGFVAGLQANMLGKPEAQAALRGTDEAAYEAAYARFRDRVATLCDTAAAAGIRLLLENNVLPQELDANALLMTRAEEFLRLFDDLQHPNLGILVDVAHTYVSAHTLGYDPGAFIKALAPYIEAFHLSENDGLRDTNEKVRADSWFLPHLSAFPDAVVVLEAYRLSAKELHQQRALLSQHLFEKTRLPGLQAGTHARLALHE